METNDHLKFILKLLGCKDYRSRLAASVFNSFKNKKKICQDLGARQLVDYTREVGSAKILPAGQDLLKLDPGQSTITHKELKVLKRIAQAQGRITPSEIKVLSVRAHRRDAILKNLSEKGLIEIETKVKRQRAEVWLTKRGIKYLRDNYNPHRSTNPIISLELLDNYVRFLRNTLPAKSVQENKSRNVDEKCVTKKVTDISDELSKN